MYWDGPEPCPFSLPLLGEVYLLGCWQWGVEQAPAVRNTCLQLVRIFSSLLLQPWAVSDNTVLGFWPTSTLMNIPPCQGSHSFSSSDNAEVTSAQGRKYWRRKGVRARATNLWERLGAKEGVGSTALISFHEKYSKYDIKPAQLFTPVQATRTPRWKSSCLFSWHAISHNLWAHTLLFLHRLTAMPTGCQLGHTSQQQAVLKLGFSSAQNYTQVFHLPCWQL